MQRKRRLLTGVAVLLALAGLVAGAAPNLSTSAARASYEVWIIDQSDTTLDGGGTLYIYQGDQLDSRDRASATPEVIDLGGDARTLCLAQTGTAPRRPHMLMFNGAHDARGHTGGQGYSHMILSFVATGHVLFMDATTREPVACIDAGAQAHAATPAPDNSYVVVANQNGKLLQRITTNYATNSFTLDPAATLDLANCQTPSGAACQDPLLRPDNAPICPIVESSSRFAFVTLRGGGLFVVDATATPMAIVGEYDRNAIHPNGCGGAELNGKLYINAGGGTPANPLESDLYVFSLRGFTTTPHPPNTPGRRLVFSHDARGFVDSHGTVLTKNGRYLWVADRAANRIVVVDTHRDSVVEEIDLTGRPAGDPAPDLMDIDPAGKLVFVALRGPNPLTANVAGVNNAVGDMPGLAIVGVERGGSWGVVEAVLPISNVVNGVELADPHGLAVRHISSR